MSHGRACSESVSTRCKCSCAGSPHGTVGAPVYRSLISSYRSTGRFAESPHHTNAHAQATGWVADRAVEVLAEVIRRSPNNADALYQAVQAVVSENAWQLLLPRLPPRRRVGRSHWLCQILAECLHQATPRCIGRSNDHNRRSTGCRIGAKPG